MIWAVLFDKQRYVIFIYSYVYNRKNMKLFHNKQGQRLSSQKLTRTSRPRELVKILFQKWNRMRLHNVKLKQFVRKTLSL